MSTSKRIVLWVLTALLAALFLFAGGMKLIKRTETIQAFAQFGYAAWFAMFIGVSEVCGAIGLLIPRLAALAAACLSINMIGALFSMATHHQNPQSAGPLIILALSIIVLRLRLTAARLSS